MDEETQINTGGISLSLLFDLFSKHKHQGLGDQKLSHNDLLDADTNFKVGTGVRSTAEGAGNETLDCGFRPALVVVFAGSDDSSENESRYWSVGAATASDSACFYQAIDADGYLKGYTTNVTINVTKLYHIYGEGYIRGSVTSFSDSGFVIAFSAVPYDCVYSYIAFK
jgi:hypothetical protein